MPDISHTPEPYDPCYCPLGRLGKKYKFCHYPIDNAPAEQRRELSQKMYVERWDKNADHFRGQGCYAWMSSVLAKYSPVRILDVGCGNGDGILAMKATCGNAKIISCDDNPACLKAAYEKIKAIGLDVKLTHRLQQTFAGEGYHEMQAMRGRLDSSLSQADFSLIEADIIWDVDFHNFLQSLGKFDAITVWLVGTYDLKPQCRNLGRKLEGQLYRLKVQNTVYRLADQILRVGGVLQVVDRGESPKEKFLIDDTLQSHTEQAEGTSLEVIEHQFKDYAEPVAGAGVPMIQALGKSGRIPTHNQLAMNSVVSIKK